MIIDLILDRKDNDFLIDQGYTHVRKYNGELESLEYSPRKFYYDVLRYGSIGDGITAAMDYGEESDVISALCDYIMEQNYNPDICDYIRSKNWLSA